MNYFACLFRVFYASTPRISSQRLNFNVQNEVPAESKIRVSALFFRPYGGFHTLTPVNLNSDDDPLRRLRRTWIFKWPCCILACICKYLSSLHTLRFMSIPRGDAKETLLQRAQTLVDELLQDPLLADLPKVRNMVYR